MPAGCGADADDCIGWHWDTELHGYAEKASHRAPCPVCGPSPRRDKRDTLTYWIERGSVRWNTHCTRCDRDKVRLKLAEKLPGCVSARYAPRHAKYPDLIELALADIPAMSLRVGLLELAGLRTNEALAKLGIDPKHKSRTIAPLRQIGR